MFVYILQFSGTLGGSCSASVACAANSNLKCSSGVCACKNGYTPNSGSCVVTPGHCHIVFVLSNNN
jgi:hypothetical protein